MVFFVFQLFMYFVFQVMVDGSILILLFENNLEDDLNLKFEGYDSLLFIYFYKNYL